MPGFGETDTAMQTPQLYTNMAENAISELKKEALGHQETVESLKKQYLKQIKAFSRVSQSL